MSAKGKGLLIAAVILTAASALFGQYQMMRVPVSGAAYVDPEQPPAAPAEQQPAWAKRVEDKLDRLLKLVEDEIQDKTPERGERPDRPDDARGRPDEKALGTGFGKCIGCHNERDARNKGDDRVYFVGKKGDELRDDLSVRDLRAIERAVKSGKMPKKGKLTQAEQDAILAFVSSGLRNSDR